MTTKPIKYNMLPYRRQGEIDYAALDFDPNEKRMCHLMHMEQNELEIYESHRPFDPRSTSPTSADDLTSSWTGKLLFATTPRILMSAFPRMCT